MMKSRDPRPVPAGLAVKLGKAAADALLEEARLPLKPGLVCPASRGAHEDMDYGLLVVSAEALRPWFAGFAAFAVGAAADPPKTVFTGLRPLGLEAEADMFRATKGINTHRGAIFALGLLAAAAALDLAGDGSPRGACMPFPGDRIRALAAEMAGGLVAAELGAAASTAGRESAGRRLYREQGARGARGQAEDGYAIVGARILPPLRAARGAGEEARQAALIVGLLGAMCDLDDTCILARGGLEGLAFTQSGAGEALAKVVRGGAESREALEGLDRALVARRLSPGGSADLLAAGIFLDAIEAELEPAAWGR